MNPRSNKLLFLVSAPLAVVCWVLGLVIVNGLTTNLSDKATDAQILAWVQGNKNPILLGCWVFMTGCAAFVFFLGALRSRLAAAEGDDGTFSMIAFAAGIMVAVLGIGGQMDVASAINADSISASTAGALHHAGDALFVGAELSFVVLLVSVAVVAFRTAVLPRSWALLGLLVAVVGYIGPIGWAALVFGLPLWTLGTAVLLSRSRGLRTVGAAAAAA